MANVKHFLITGIVLGSIALVSGALIGVANLVTKDRIDQNEKNEINKGITSIFGSNAKIKEAKAIGEVTNKQYEYVETVYFVTNQEDNLLGYGFRSTGSNMYGKISLISGFKYDAAFIGVYLVTNEQTYASTLVDNYVTPLNDGSRNLDDVKCGATYGAKLVQSLVDESKVALGDMGV